jgi:ACS family hexuronate transporter-like MFS transporter
MVGTILDSYKEAGNITAGYNIIFIVCGFAYLLAWGLMHLFAPKMEKWSGKLREFVKNSYFS